jgi:hypothetical protein
MAARLSSALRHAPQKELHHVVEDPVEIAATQLPARRYVFGLDQSIRHGP